MMVNIYSVGFGVYEKYIPIQKEFFSKFWPEVNYYCYTDRDILSLLTKGEENDPLLNSFHNRSYTWKPFLLSKIAKLNSKSETLNIYVDLCDILLGIPSIRKRESVSLYIPKYGNKIIEYTKMEDLTNFRVRENKKIINSTQVEAGLIVFRNNQFAVSFFERWYSYMVNSFKISSKSDIQFDNFIADRQDQSILSLLLMTDYAKNPSLGLKNYGKIHRSNLLPHLEDVENR